jgi:hypothetical protein
MDLVNTSDHGTGPGDRVRLVHTPDPETRLIGGEIGTVTLIDGLGTVHVDWDSGSRLGLVPEQDAWEVICPRCAVAIPTRDDGRRTPGALSRRDDATQVCERCGYQEALLVHERRDPWPGFPLPIEATSPNVVDVVAAVVALAEHLRGHAEETLDREADLAACEQDADREAVCDALHELVSAINDVDAAVYEMVERDTDPTQHWILGTLPWNGDAAIADIAKCLKRSRIHVLEAARGLEARGLVEVHDPANGLGPRVQFLRNGCVGG